MRSPHAGALQRTLRDSPGTVTQVLEELTGEAMVAHVVRRDAITAGADDALGVPPGQPMMHRIAVLKGSTSQEPYLYAESTFDPRRLPETAGVRLARTNDPIGRIVIAHGFNLKRVALPRPGLPALPPAITAGEPAAEVVWSRAYVLLLDDLPAFAIREWFFRSVLEARDRSRRK
jgi:chorismate-pyruvate lyase